MPLPGAVGLIRCGMLSRVADKDVVAYQIPRQDLPWLRRAWIVLLILAAVLALGEWFGRHRVPLNSIVLVFIAAGALAIQKFGARRSRQLLADSRMIRRPRPLGPLRWADIDHVLAPNQWSDGAFVVMRNGSTKRTGLPPEYAERLAALGGKPLR